MKTAPLVGLLLWATGRSVWLFVWRCGCGSGHMNNPYVVGVMLTADRPEMTRRAIASFEAQTYPNKALLLLDSGEEKVRFDSRYRIVQPYVALDDPKRGNTGYLRNMANALIEIRDCIIIHFDSDDWSHPKRLEEQVRLLQNSGAECVGYNEILFWDTTPKGAPEAWVYENDALACVSGFNPGYEETYPAVGASYCYWRKTWERQPFMELVKGEDTDWLRRGIKCYGTSSIPGDERVLVTREPIEPEPRLICEIHGGNTSSTIKRGFNEYRGAQRWDKYCADRMKL